MVLILALSVSGLHSGNVTCQGENELSGRKRNCSSAEVSSRFCPFFSFDCVYTLSCHDEMWYCSFLVLLLHRLLKLLLSSNVQKIQRNLQF